MANPDNGSKKQGSCWSGEDLDSTDGSNSAHIWTVCLDRDESAVRELRSFLSQEERDHSSKYRFATHRNRFIIRRGTLRMILGEYLGMQPEVVRYRTGQFGKLYLADSSRTLEFNVTHSHTMALIAVTQGGSIGIDLECVRPLPDLEAMIDTCLSRSERRHLDSFPSTLRLESFYRYWTCKEAYLKALGVGLDRSLASVQVSVTVSETGHEATLQTSSQEQTDLAITSFVPHNGYMAAMAAPASVRPVMKTATLPD